MLTKLRSSVPKISALILMLSLCCNTHAQSEPECGTVMSPEVEADFLERLPELQNIEKNYQQNFLSRSADNTHYVPIKAHVLRKDDGTGGLTNSQLNNAIIEMNAFYINASIEFFICSGINYIDNTEYYNFNKSEEYQLTNTYNIDDVINIYFANSVVSSTGSSLCGYAYYPGGPETILMKNSCAINGSTLAHEMGHFFALAHTHGNSSTTTELVNGSNCDTNGDYICDTPADPKLSYSNVNYSCSYVGTDTDANNDTYVPDEQNIMSYSRKECRTAFSQQQYARINAVMQSSRSNLTCPDYNVAFGSSYTNDCNNSMTVAFTDNSTGATSWAWDVDEDGVTDYTTQNPTHTYSDAGKYDVSLTITGNNASPITMVEADFVNIGVRELNTNKLKLTLNTDNRPSEITWKVTDEDGNVLDSGGPYSEGSQDYVTLNKTITVDTSNGCYTFEIMDSAGNGLSGGNGGSYQLRDNDNNVIITGSDFGSEETTVMASGTLSSESFMNKTNFSLHPNPAKSDITIALSNHNLMPDAFEIYNMMGQKMLQRKVNSISDLSINVAPLSEGIYVIKLKKDAGLLSIPFIKN